MEHTINILFPNSATKCISIKSKVLFMNSPPNLDRHIALYKWIWANSRNQCTTIYHPRTKTLNRRWISIIPNRYLLNKAVLLRINKRFASLILLPTAAVYRFSFVCGVLYRMLRKERGTYRDGNYPMVANTHTHTHSRKQTTETSDNNQNVNKSGLEIELC